MSQPESPTVYEGSVDDERLLRMASFIDPITQRHLDALGLSAADYVLDIGAGVSPHLGDHIIATGADYLALDQNAHAVEQQTANGHQARHGLASRIPLEANSVSVVHGRFSLSWVHPEQRPQVWDEINRVGGDNRKVLITDYDWSVAAGPPDYMQLIGTMQQVLIKAGFDPAYGAELPAEASRYLEVPDDTYQLEAIREPIPTETGDEKKEIIGLTAKTLVAELRKRGQLETAESLEQQLRKVEALDAESTATIRLADVVSVVFHSVKTAGGSAAIPLPAEAREHLLKLHVVRVGLDDPEHPLRDRARRLFSRMYTRAGFLDTGLTAQALQEATDPDHLLSRSDVFVGYQGDRLVNTVRLLHPATEGTDGLKTLPTGEKLIEAGAQEALTTDEVIAKIGEIMCFASTASDERVTVQSVIELMMTAVEAKMSHVIFGAVEGGPSEHFRRLFGPTLTWLQAGTEPLRVTVKGTGYRPEGIKLLTGYLATGTFLEQLERYYRSLAASNKSAGYIIDLCQSRQRQRQEEVNAL